MIGRADIEGSKSNVAMKAWLPQASYPCGNFSDTSSFKFRSRIPLVRTSSESTVRRPGKAPEGAVPVRPPAGTRQPALAAGCSPWRPDAVMSTTGRGRHSVLRIFKGRQGRTGHRATCGALPAAGPYLRLSRFQGGQAVKQKR
ncbi:hypothetical protein AgCh_010923 [Apium graveolens]